MSDQYLQEPAALTNSIAYRPYDPYDVHDRSTAPEQQRQQRRLPLHQAGRGAPSVTQSSTSSRNLRRTPELETLRPPQPRRTHIEAASVGISPSPSPPRVRFAEPLREGDDQGPSDNTTDEGDSAPNRQVSASRAPRHPALRVSNRTASAIFYAVEVALRQPHPFTPDLLEENASMSDLTGGVPGNGRLGNGASRLQQQAPAPAGSPGGRIRGPTDIMRDRAEREARRKAEREALELQRIRAEEDARAQAEEERRRAAIPAAAGAVPARTSGGETSASGRVDPTAPPQRISDQSQSSGGAPPSNTIQGRGRGGSALGGGDPATATRPPRGPTVPQVGPRPNRPTQTAPVIGPLASQPGPSTGAPSVPQPPQPPQPPQQTRQTQQPEAPQAAAAPRHERRGTQSSFPHAFERWETLSSHWEGLTSFWIRRIEANTEEIERDALSAQLARQVTDLSAAGANLFHAVVELQRLRASSERKFQRWFFETRANDERHREELARLEATLAEERRGREEAIADAVSKEREKSTSDKLLAEMKRELQISKDEARRAWEELGRREQEERERIMALREGHQIQVGGVNVVPMMQGVPSRNTSVAQRGQTREESPYESPPLEPADVALPPSGYMSPSAQDPFVENSRRDAASPYPAPLAPASKPTSQPQFSSSTAPAVQPPTTSATFYQQHQGTTLHPTGAGEEVRSEGTYSDTEYDIDPRGEFRRDSRGNKIRYSDPQSDDGSDEMDVSAERAQEIAHLQQYGNAPTMSATYMPGQSSAMGGGRGGGIAAAPPRTTGPPVTYAAPEYEGGRLYGSTEQMWVPTHHHPTRLSDVLEEDERSRTTASQIGRAD